METTETYREMRTMTMTKITDSSEPRSGTTRTSFSRTAGKQITYGGSMGYEDEVSAAAQELDEFDELSDMVLDFE